MVMSEASLATDVPSPIESPTWAVLSAGASFVPSPVTATHLIIGLKGFYETFLSIGRARAMIFVISATLFQRECRRVRQIPVR